MSLRLLQSSTLIAATITTGLMAGLFSAFAYAIMPALNKSSDRTFVETMQRINVAILNGWFMISFMGALLLTILATIFFWRGDNKTALPWIIAGLVLYGLMFLITSGINVPLNNQLADAGDPDKISNLAAVRDQFETKWVVWNIVRAVTNTAAFAVLAWALILHGRATPTEDKPTSSAAAPQHHYQAPAPYTHR